MRRTIPAAMPAPKALIVERLRLRDVRNYSHLEIDIGQGSAVICGENGAGKTNILEAISLLGPGRGFRHAELRVIDRLPDGGPWSVAARLAGRLGRFEITSARDVDQERRIVALDGRPCRDRERLGDLVGIVWLTPANDRLFQENPGERRRFLDRLVQTIHPRHAAMVATNERLLRDRAALLREGKLDAAWLRVLESRIAANGVAVTASRLHVVSALDRMLGHSLGTFPTPRLRLKGEVERWLREAPAAVVEERLAEALAIGRTRDAESGGAAVGPHRSDLQVEDAASGAPAGACSTGHQKALLISMILAYARLRGELIGELPILLLDELAAHLDARRRAEILETLLALGAQAWLTGADPETFSVLKGRANFLRVDKGTVTTHERAH